MASSARLFPPPPKPLLLRSHKAGVWYRVHPGKYAPAAFNASGLGDARFSPLVNPTTKKTIPTMYAASDERGAIAEVVLHNVPTPSAGYIHDLEADYKNDLRLSRIGTSPLQLVNLTTLGLKASGLTPSDLFEGDQDDYPRTREWALWIWQNMPDAQGLHWMSKRDNRCAVIVLFGDRIHSTGVWDDKSSQSLQAHEDLVVDLLAQMGASISPSI